jgi:hypothetical protein
VDRTSTSTSTSTRGGVIIFVNPSQLHDSYFSIGPPPLVLPTDNRFSEGRNDLRVIHRKSDELLVVAREGATL